MTASVVGGGGGPHQPEIKLHKQMPVYAREHPASVVTGAYNKASKLINVNKHIIKYLLLMNECLFQESYRC